MQFSTFNLGLTVVALVLHALTQQAGFPLWSGIVIVAAQAGLITGVVMGKHKVIQ